MSNDPENSFNKIFKKEGVNIKQAKQDLLNQEFWDGIMK